MAKRIVAAGLVLIAITAVVCAGDKPKPTVHAGLERMKKLAGTWVVADKGGKPTDQVVSVIKVIGGGTVVHETLFPGQAHEMVSAYHLDGDDLVMTHFCALGNQPRMKAHPKSLPGRIRFQFAGGTNIDPAKDKPMHDATLTFVDDDNLHVTGSCWEGGKQLEGQCYDMTLVRKN